MSRVDECPHGHPLAAPVERGGYLYRAPEDCRLCAEDGWETCGYRAPVPDGEDPGKAP